MLKMKVDGLKSLKNVKAVLNKVRGAQIEAMNEALGYIANKASENVKSGLPFWPPKQDGEAGLWDTGALANSFRHRVISGGNEIVGEVWSDEDYAAYHELGIEGCARRRGAATASGDAGGAAGAIPPRPFLLPAFVENQETIVNIFRRHARRILG
jgi:phage gpG-like protein